MLAPMTELDIAAVLTQLTLTEKAALCSGSNFWKSEGNERLGIPAVILTDGPHGVRLATGAGDQIGLHDSVPATCFPPAVALGSCWNPELVQRVGVALGLEARASRVAVLLGPGINIKRSPLAGRNFEYFSEDPLVSGRMGAALVRGIQSVGVAASVKHFAANNQETDRMRVDAVVDERTLREIYLPAFEEVVTTASPWTVMCSYNKLNGIYASQHRWLLTDLLRYEWGFDGLVMSDWGAVDDRVAGLAAGLDLEMPSSGGHFDAEIVAAVSSGALPPADLDAAVTRLLTLLNRTDEAVSTGGTFDVDAHHELARTVAAESAVLLKNDGDLLPLDPDRTGTLAVIGEFARTPRYQGAGSSLVNPTRMSTALDELGARVPVTFAAGYTVDAPSDAGLLAEAVALAAQADTVVLFLGLPPSDESEGWDRQHLELPDDQLALVAAVGAANPRTAVVLANGSVVSVTPWQDDVAAVLEGWLLGQAGGAAIADLLLGAISPSGRLTETIPLRLQDNPSYGNFPGEHGVVRYGEGLLVGYRHYDTRDIAVAYPFGHGLSYTTFSYGPVTATVTGSGNAVAVEVTVGLTNTGPVAGSEVVQLYVHDVEAGVFRPEQELRAFAKVLLEPGETRMVALRLDARAFAFFHSLKGRWVVEAGEFELRVGSSSRDLRARTVVDIAAEPLTVGLDTGSTLAEFAADPVVGERVCALLGLPPGAGLDADEMFTMLGSAPLQRLSRFPNAPISPEQLSELLAAANGAHQG